MRKIVLSIIAVWTLQTVVSFAEQKEAKPDLKRLLTGCGIVPNKGDPAEQKAKDIDACLAYVRAAFTLKFGAEVRVNANSIAEGLCMAENNGEACRYRALSRQMGVWSKTTKALEEARAITGYLDDACKYGDKDACSILKDKKDASGRTWAVEVP